MSTQEFSCDIFIKSYAGDLPWLRWCLKSIQHYWMGKGKTLIVVPPDCLEAVNPMLHDRQEVIGREEVFGSHPNPTGRQWGYWEQTAVKMMADQYTDAPLIFFMDSDWVLSRPCSEADFLHEGTKPTVYWETYAYFQDKHPGVLAWKFMVEGALKTSVDGEYMRAPGFLYWADSLKHFRKHLEALHGMPFLDVVHSVPNGGFSEFNAIGAFLRVHEPDRYHWVKTEYPGDWWPVKSHWSWGGITPEIEMELHRIVG